MKTRYITTLIQQSLKHFPVVLLIGARQAGKSTLARQIVKEGLINDYVTLDDLTMLEAASRDPDGFIEQYTAHTIALDEVQRVPELLRAIKKNVDEYRKPGRFLLTGSANVLSYPSVTESLAGRMDVIHLEGLSTSEILGQPHPSQLLERLFTSDALKSVIDYCHQVLKRKNTIDKNQLRDYIFYGGFPEVVLKENLHFRDRWFAAYQNAYIARDVRDLAKLLDTISFSRVLRLVGLRTANLLNVKNIAVDVGLDQRTVSRYLQLLELTFQVNQLPPWHANTRKRLVKTPKIYLNDSGMACYLAGIHEPNRLEENPMWGALFETWAWSEIRKLLALTTGIQTSYYRTHQGREVDFVLEKGKQCWGIEIKASKSVSQSDFAGLLDMQDAMKHTAQGIIFYMGNQIVHFSKTLLAVPLVCLLS